MNVTISDFAFQEQANIKKYIKKDSAFYANNFIQKIIDNIQILADFRNLVRILPNFNNKIKREIFQKKPHKIISWLFWVKKKEKSSLIKMFYNK